LQFQCKPCIIIIVKQITNFNKNREESKMKTLNTKNSNTKNSNQPGGNDLKKKLETIKKVDTQELEKKTDAIINNLEAVNKELELAMESGDPERIEKALALAEKAKNDSENSDKKLKTELNVDNNTVNSVISENVTSTEIKNAVASELIVDGTATSEEVKQAMNEAVVEEEAVKVANEINEVKTEEVKQEEVKQEEVKQEEVKQEEVKQEEVTAEEVKTEEVKTEEVKTEEVKMELSEDDKLIEQFKQDNEAGNKDKAQIEPNTNKKTNKELIAKAWQRVSNDGNSLINVITFMGKKVDYSVGLKHKYRFPNLSVADGTNRIITAKFPKEDTKPTSESISFKEYTLHINKYGNSAVCTLHDPDGICMLEYVSLATIIDVLQDELNPGQECTISWGTIDQIIKHKRGLKSRVKSLNVDDEPSRKRGGEVTTTEVAASTEISSPETTTPNVESEKEAVAQ
jgi:chemotaxis protein histidine kinase CheA